MPVQPAKSTQLLQPLVNLWHSRAAVPRKIAAGTQPVTIGSDADRRLALGDVAIAVTCADYAGLTEDTPGARSSNAVCHHSDKVDVFADSMTFIGKRRHVSY